MEVECHLIKEELRPPRPRMRREREDDRDAVALREDAIDLKDPK